jgi:hypothetical protein
MNPLMSARSVGYVCLTVLAMFALHSCGNKGLSDEAAKAVAETCKAAGQSINIRLTSSEIKAECVKP